MLVLQPLTSTGIRAVSPFLVKRVLTDDAIDEDVYGTKVWILFLFYLSNFFSLKKKDCYGDGSLFSCVFLAG